MKKILYIITQSELGGAQRYVFDLSENLQNDHNITIAVGGQGESCEFVQRLKKIGFVYKNKINRQSPNGNHLTYHSDTGGDPVFVTE